MTADIYDPHNTKGCFVCTHTVSNPTALFFSIRNCWYQLLTTYQCRPEFVSPHQRIIVALKTTLRSTIIRENNNRIKAE